MNNKNLALALLVFLTFGCDKNRYRKPDPSKADKATTQEKEQTKAVNLAGKTLEEVLKIKFTKAVLKCELWTQISNKLDVSVLPNASASWDLKSDVSKPDALSLKSEIQNHKVAIEIKINSVSLRSSFTYVDNNSNRYTISNSPSINVNIIEKSLTTFPTGPFSTSGTGSSIDVNERIKNVYMNGALATKAEQQEQQNKEETEAKTDPVSYRDYAHCFVDTEIRPEYQDQFKVEAKAESKEKK